MIIVTGATGQLGRIIVGQLAARVPTDQIGVSVRDPEKAKDLEALGVRVRHGDFGKPASLTYAFEDATQVLLVSSNARAYGGDPLAQHGAAIEAARAAGATRIVYTSQMAASPASAFAPAVDHAATEDMLHQSGLAWTALRNGFYASSGLMSLGDSLKTGILETPVDGKVAWTTHADLAEAAAVILADEGRFDGPTPPLTAAQALDLTELTGIASELLERRITHTVFSDGELGLKLAARGVPAGAAKFMLGMYLASRAGEFATVDPTLEQLLGRAPITMRAVIAQKLGV